MALASTLQARSPANRAFCIVYRWSTSMSASWSLSDKPKYEEQNKIILFSFLSLLNGPIYSIEKPFRDAKKFHIFHKLLFYTDLWL